MKLFHAFILGGWLLCGPFVQAHSGPGIVVDQQGVIYFVSGNRVVRVTPDGTGKVILEDPKQENFFQLHHLILDRQGQLYTAGDAGRGVWKVSRTGVLTRFFPPANEDRSFLVGLGGDPFAIDNEGHLFALNARQFRFTQILKISPAGQIAVLAGGLWGNRDGVGEQARFGDLHGSQFVLGPDGTLFLTDNYMSVRKVAPDGTVTTLAGGTERGYVDAAGMDARFDGACGLALDKEGNVFVADTENQRIRKISPQGMTTTLAGSSKSGTTDGPLLAARFTRPTGVALGPEGAVLVLDHDQQRIRRIHRGVVTTLFALQ